MPEKIAMTKEKMLGGTFALPNTSLSVHRMGYGAMQLAGPEVLGPPLDQDTAVAVLRNSSDEHLLFSRTSLVLSSSSPTPPLPGGRRLDAARTDVSDRAGCAPNQVPFGTNHAFPSRPATHRPGSVLPFSVPVCFAPLPLP
jgi:hypothetical protein